MIRLVRRALIIPQGDTGTFTIPTLGEVAEGDIAILSIYDTLTHLNVLEKVISATPDSLTFSFESQDTLGLEPDDEGHRYVWDITLLRGAIYNENNEITGYSMTDSYYASYKLPYCKIRRVTRNV